MDYRKKKENSMTSRLRLKGIPSLETTVKSSYLDFLGCLKKNLLDTFGTTRA